MRFYLKIIFLAWLVLTSVAGTAFAQLSVNDFQICSLNGRERLWAQHRLNADLMNSYIDEQHLRNPSLAKRVYVLDSGFDSSQIPNLMHAETFSLEPGVYGDLTTRKPGPGESSLVGDPAHDIAGHGTMVVSVIAAKAGVGVAPHTDVTLFRITPESDAAHAGTTGDSFIDYAMLRACNQGRAQDKNGVIVINDSWASRASESGQQSLNKRNPRLVEKLKQMGCLVVQAAGNNAFVGPLALETDDSGPLLQVSATEPFNLTASFSSSGLIAAPGEKVYALASHFVGIGSRNDSCEASDKVGDTPRTFVSGTSFSSPMTAGIAAEIAGVLESNQSNEFLNLAPAEKVRLVIRVLEASAEGSSNTTNIDALRAVLIAERWRSGFSSVKTLKNLLSQDRPRACGIEPKSFNEKRFLISGCSDSVDPQIIAQVKSDLAASALQSKAFETTAGFLDLENANPARAEAFAQKYVASKAQGQMKDEALGTVSLQRSLRLGLDASFSRTLMPAYLKSYVGHAPNLMIALLTSWSTQQYLERGPERGSEPILKALVDNLEQVEGSLVPHVLTEFTHYWLNTLDQSQPVFNADTLSTLVRILNEVRTRPKLEFAYASLDVLDEDVLVKLNEFPALFGKDLEQVVIGPEIYQNRLYLFSFFERLNSRFYQSLDQEHPEKLAQVAVEYLLEKPFSSSHLGLKFLAKIINLVDGTEAWKLSNVSLKQALADVAKKQLLEANAKEIDIWLDTLNYSAAEAGRVIDEVAYQIARDLGRATKINTSHQTEILVLQKILSNPAAVTKLHQGGFGKSAVNYLRVTATGSRQDEFPPSFVDAISAF